MIEIDNVHKSFGDLEVIKGVSLTVNWVEKDDFSINLIPHTVAVTNLKHLKAGSKVNLEIDLIARYVERMTAWEHGL